MQWAVFTHTPHSVQWASIAIYKHKHQFQGHRRKEKNNIENRLYSLLLSALPLSSLFASLFLNNFSFMQLVLPAQSTKTLKYHFVVFILFEHLENAFLTIFRLKITFIHLVYGTFCPLFSPSPFEIKMVYFSFIGINEIKEKYHNV